MRRTKTNNIVKTMKLRIHPDAAASKQLAALTKRYAEACNLVSQYAFDHGVMTDSNALQRALYYDVRDQFGLKSQLTCSVMKTVAARYKTVKEQLRMNPYKYEDEDGNKVYIQRTLEWLWKPIQFRRPQADLARGRDYSFATEGSKTLLSLNTLDKRVEVSFDAPKVFKEYFKGGWKFGTGKLVQLKGNWYFHIPMTKKAEEYDISTTKHIVGIDRGLRFLSTSYDETGKTAFVDGHAIMRKRDTFQTVRSQLQAKGTKSAKRALKRISGRENRWMTDVNHRLTKTLVQKYGPNTLFVLEDLTGASFDEDTLSHRNKKGRKQLRTWAFYQYEQFLTYKAHAAGSKVVKFQSDYTSQRCPKCGRIHKENRKHNRHEYICDCCGYRSNDDRIAAMNIQFLGMQYLAGDPEPKFSAPTEE